MGGAAVIYGLGPRGRRVYEALRDRIVRGRLEPGTKLPSHRELAADFGVAPMTVRQVLGRLEAEGLLSRQVGRGTFVRAPSGPVVLVVDDEPGVRSTLSAYITALGFPTLAASGPAEGYAALTAEPAIGVLLSGLRLPTATDGTEFIRAVRRRWPGLPVAALITHTDDLAGLRATDEWPLLIVPKPIRLGHIEELLRLTLTTGALG
jgi:DNA-binding transcriptional regulator YhcF (GntR family)